MRNVPGRKTWCRKSCICERLTCVIYSLTEAWNTRRGSRHGRFEANFELEDGGCGAEALNTWGSGVVDDGGLATLPVLIVYVARFKGVHKSSYQGAF